MAFRCYRPAAKATQRPIRLIGRASPIPKVERSPTTEQVFCGVAGQRRADANQAVSLTITPSVVA
jgi:hypothetical protein